MDRLRMDTGADIHYAVIHGAMPGMELEIPPDAATWRDYIFSQQTSLPDVEDVNNDNTLNEYESIFSTRWR